MLPLLDENGNTIPVLTNNDKAGNIRYQDIDGDGKITASADRVRLGNSLPENAIRWLSMGRMERLGFQFIISRCWTSISLLELARYTIQLSSICLSGKSDRKPLESDSNGCRKCQAKYPKLTTNSANIYAKSDFYIFNGALYAINQKHHI
mgnify:CR=1 FL=1